MQSVLATDFSRIPELLAREGDSCSEQLSPPAALAARSPEPVLADRVLAEPVLAEPVLAEAVQLGLF